MLPTWVSVTSDFRSRYVIHPALLGEIMAAQLSNL